MNVEVIFNGDKVGTAYLNDGPVWDKRGLSLILRHAIEKGLLYGPVKKINFVATLGGGEHHNLSGPSWSHYVEKKPIYYKISGVIKIAGIQHWHARDLNFVFDEDEAVIELNKIKIDVT